MYYKKEGLLWNRYNNIPELLADTCSRHSDLVLFSWTKGRKVIEKTYREWGQDVLEAAELFAKMDAAHIGVVCDLTYECILSIFAAITAGKTVVLMESGQSGTVYGNYTEKADVELVLYHAAEAEEKTENCRWMQFEQLLKRNAEGNPQNRAGESFENRIRKWLIWEPDRPACIFFTSGTTGGENEKSCVLLSQRNIAITNSVTQRSEKLPCRAETILYLTMHHLLGFSGVVSFMMAGYKMFLGKGPKYLQVELLNYHPNMLLSVPLVNELLMKGVKKGIKDSGKQDAFEKAVKLTRFLWRFKIDVRPQVFKDIYKGLGGRLRVLPVSGASIRPETVRFFEDLGIYILDGYGMTETAGLIAQNTLKRLKTGSVGIVMPYNEVKIVDGEILVRGDNVMLGYYKDPEATARVIENGWLKTGDLGYLDEKGYLYITGRKKNLIILSNGVNVSPEELEKELMKHSCIQEVIVREKNGHIHAEIYAGESMQKDAAGQKMAIDGALRIFNQSRQVYERIVSWELREEPFEKTPMMKIRR